MRSLSYFGKGLLAGVVTLCGLWVFYVLTPAQNLEKLQKASRNSADLVH